MTRSDDCRWEMSRAFRPPIVPIRGLRMVHFIGLSLIRRIRSHSLLDFYPAVVVFSRVLCTRARASTCRYPTSHKRNDALTHQIGAIRSFHRFCILPAAPLADGTCSYGLPWLTADEARFGPQYRHVRKMGLRNGGIPGRVV
jgi:hypothetical protein